MTMYNCVTFLEEEQIPIDICLCVRNSSFCDVLFYLIELSDS